MSLGRRNLAIAIAPCGALAWAIGLYPFGILAGIGGGVVGALGGIFGAAPLARLEQRAHAEGGFGRWCRLLLLLVVLWLLLVILPAIIGAVARFQQRSAPHHDPLARERL